MRLPVTRTVCSGWSDPSLTSTTMTPRIATVGDCACAQARWNTQKMPTRELEEAREARRRTSPRSGDGSERSGRATGPLVCRLQWLCHVAGVLSCPEARWVPRRSGPAFHLTRAGRAFAVGATSDADRIVFRIV